MVRSGGDGRSSSRSSSSQWEDIITQHPVRCPALSLAPPPKEGQASKYFSIVLIIYTRLCLAHASLTLMAWPWIGASAHHFIIIADWVERARSIFSYSVRKVVSLWPIPLSAPGLSLILHFCAGSVVVSYVKEDLIWTRSFRLSCKMIAVLSSPVPSPAFLLLFPFFSPPLVCSINQPIEGVKVHSTSC